MKTNIEIEFKSKINEETYEKLIKQYDLSSSCFSQTNYYFDTDNLDLLNQHIALRIREKNQNYKITLKKGSPEGALEQHIIIDFEKAQELLANGFETSAYFQELNYKVKFLAKLTTKRVKMLYEGGVIFLDKSTYNDHVDYEIEFEHNNYDLGEKQFKDFLSAHQIAYMETHKKSYRALMTR